MQEVPGPAAGAFYSSHGGLKVKKIIITLSAAALVVVAPAMARDAAGKTPSLHHAALKRHHTGLVRPHEMQAGGFRNGYPSAFGYAPAGPGAPAAVDKDIERSRQAGGGGGGGGM
jgi:hypothetical protein